MKIRHSHVLTAFLAFLVSPVNGFAGEKSLVEVRAEIQDNLIYNYADAWDRKDCGRWAALFTSDGKIDFSGDANLSATAKSAVGTDEIRAFCEKRMSSVLSGVETRHFMTNNVIYDVTDDSAKSQTYALVTWQKPSDTAPVIQVSLTYRDLIVRQNGRWLLKERHIE